MATYECELESRKSVRAHNAEVSEIGLSDRVIKDDRRGSTALSVLPIDVYADIVCPWCFIGFRRLNAAVQSTGRAGDVAIHHRTFMIHPDAPPEGIDLWTMLERKYRTDPQRLFERVEAAALETGIPLDLSKQRRTYSTIAAHTLLRHAGQRETQHALTDSLFTAYFLHSKNIGEPDVLTTIAIAAWIQRRRSHPSGAGSKRVCIDAA